ncbi:hypothetical protein SAMN06297280_2371 [Arsukibacterium tuosuense]|uniref:Pectate lyase C n=1 Tax=Arsukibacterium tuosuense TaxID=1323745 RepID=A0A285J1U4_9GAMM|nr:hypothetical protein [Arsukibacterium tuosuense]SNY53336.1 hypothetical protein SAMN06297280_2371 [Arsukibacterium tuosuense]
MVLLRSLAVALSLLLIGCGGSSTENNSSTSPPEPVSYTLAGEVVKGPWLNANIRLYELSRTAPEFKGSQVASTRTGNDGRFKNLKVVAPKAEYYLLVASVDTATTELVTEQVPYAKSMMAIVSRAQVESNSKVNVTPFSTLLTHMVIIDLVDDSDAIVSSIMADALENILATVGFNLNETADLLSASPLITDSATLQSDFRFRQASEALAVILFHLTVNTEINFDEALAALAEDISDGIVDSQRNGEPVATFAQLPDLVARWQALAVRHLSVPGTSLLTDDGKDITLDQLPLLLHAEASASGGSVMLSDINTVAFENRIKSFGPDLDSDGYPDVVDDDIDGDGYLNANDAFPRDATEWLDTDGDGLGNNADADDDNDGYPDNEDAFPLDPTEWLDTDGDGIGNNADPDDDNDGYTDAQDAFPLDATEWLDTDGDGIGNNADADDDNDGYPDNEDAFPLDPTEWLDTDGDGIGNNADPDDDNDGYTDAQDAFPLDATEWLDTDGDGIGNNADPDDDNDGYPDNEDAFPLDASEWLDTDGDGIGNNADPDDDSDGVADVDDLFPLDPSESADYDSDGIGDNSDPDRDNDGIQDIEDDDLNSLIYRDQVISIDVAFLQSIAAVGMSVSEDDDRIIITGGEVHLPPTAENAWYLLQKTLQVGLDNEAHATLRLSPGTLLAVQNAKSSLVVSRGSKIIAFGYRQSPITLTSVEDVEGLEAMPGQWGGLTVLGKAKNNRCSPDDLCTIVAPGLQIDNYHGGNQADDNSGILEYLRIKNAGSSNNFTSDTHAGLGLYSVGASTVLSHIHIDSVAGDGLALDGGNAKLKRLIVTGAADDSLDWSSGYTGDMQFVLLQHAADHSKANRAIEADNASYDVNAIPVSNPTIANLTIIGNNFDGDDDSEGIFLRHGSRGYISNAIVTGPSGMGECLEIDGNTVESANSGFLTITHTVMACENGENFKSPANFDIESWFLAQAGNAVESERDTVLNGYFSSVNATAIDLSVVNTFFEQTDYIGAVISDADWTADWSLLEK